MKFYIYTLGCKVNAYESEMMKEKLLENGYVMDREAPDIVIVNTCSVTNTADNKSFKTVRHFKKNHNNAILVVCGCSSENKNTEYEQMGIDILIGNNEKSEIVSLIKKYLEKKEAYVKFYHTRKLPFEDMSVREFKTHTRAFVKIQDGCDNFCSYCIIPYVRGSIRSKNFDVALKEIKTLVDHGHKEIVLTGIHTGSYGENESYDLTDLIHEMSKNEELKRIRISSIEVTELNDKFFEELAQNPKICDHMHIPLQAGSNEILKKMNRKYDLDYFEKKIKRLRSIRPNISITTDVIVGHPYETEDLFLETIETVKRIKFSKIHVFPYSKREGTLASRMPEQVSDVEKKRRSKKLCELSEVLEKSYANQFLGRTLEVLVEKSDEESIGCTSNYLKVRIKKQIPKNTLVPVVLEKYEKKEIIGTCVKKF